ncbi:response regulator [Paraburkholderia sp. JHI2823]|uniref:response regulator n=1 Tax=Paraburkholderia TaxID=1822464 RepID=UPI00041FA940|nr:response regulator [Paraburkholderia mimosarum]
MIPQPLPEPGVAQILIAEDDVLVRLALAEALRAVGFGVIEASCADDALAYIRAGGTVDLVFSDIQMPGKVDGRELAALIASDHPGIPVILTSGDTALAGNLPAVLFVAKPYSLAHTVALLLSVLDRLPPKGHS